MPSIQDVADQVNAKLDNITSHTSSTATNTDAIKIGVNSANTKLTLLDNHLQAGFANTSQGIFALTELEKASIALAEQNRQQNDTIICLLTNSNDLLCGITRKLTRQLQLAEALLLAARRLEAIAVRTRPGEAADYDRELAMNAKVEECCPPPPPQLEPCPPPCDKSPYRPYEPKGKDWTPLPNPRPDNPAAPGA